MASQDVQYDDNDKNRNSVTGMVEAKTFAVKYTGADGKKQMCLAMVFGKDAEDSGPAVFIVADNTQMATTLRVAGKTLRDGVRQRLAMSNEITADDIPDDSGLDDGLPDDMG